MRKCLVTLGILLGLLTLATPTLAGRYLESNKIEFLFSGSSVEASGNSTCIDFTGLGEEILLNFKFDPNGTFSVRYRCFNYHKYETGDSGGKWHAKGDQLCLAFDNPNLNHYMPTDAQCWDIGVAGGNFTIFSDNSVMWRLTVRHPKHGTKDEIFAAMQSLPSSTMGPKTQSLPSAALDSAAWERVKFSTRVSDFQQYLTEFPNGMFAELAENQVRTLIERQANPEAVKSQFAGIDFGTYHALIIGIDNYKHLPKLNTAVADARSVSEMLEKNYGFKIRLLIDPERTDIIDALDEYRETLGSTDNLLIYYAGHGWMDAETEEGYWLARSAKSNRRSRWVSNAAVTNSLKALAAKHVMVVADSCYSGTLTRSAAISFRDANYYKRMATKQARVAMVSGGLEPVADDSGTGNSPFAAAFIRALGENADVLDGTRLFSEIRRPVMLNAKQTPQYSDVRQAGHDGGDFLFVRKR